MHACILCIEDEVTLLNDVRDELTTAGYRVLTATSASEALEHLQNTRPDLILCDVMLGSDSTRDGYFVHQHIRGSRPDLADTPFLFLSALGHRSAILEAKREGIDDYLVKPVDYDMLLATIAARLSQVARLRTHVQRQQPNLLHRLQAIFEQLPGAVILCNAAGQLLYATPKALRLSEEEGIWQRNVQGNIIWPALSTTSALRMRQCLNELAAPGQRSVLALDRVSAGSPVVASLLCLESHLDGTHAEKLLAIFVSSTQSRPLPDAETLRQLFALTPSEAAVALLLAQGRRSEEVASELGVSSTTIAFHLRNLFSKTGAARQSDLVALVLSTGWAMPDTNPGVAKK
ncbi:response regulator [Pseudomonas sp. PDM14]|uniref:response regulator n=1 Tax=Pseudomonas sp. PDM14 TaxID=2769288 RepID=UPI00177B9895|nr:response regulator [Pseudomonas sp. PDM14]MBD9482229.1 response regulator [Pseudomonas sp. PDM14]